MKLLEIAGSVASVVSFVAGLIFQLYKDSAVGTYAAYGLALVFLVATIVLHLYHRADSNETSKLNRLTGTIDISSLGERAKSVFYAKKFKSPPYLNLRLMYEIGDIEILEQRADGFKFKVSIRRIVRAPRELPLGPMSGPIPYIEWAAEGEFEE
jgi:hypothetical protein